MRKVTIRELHLATGNWVRRAARREPVVITDRGRPVAALVPFDRLVAGKSLPDRRGEIRKLPRVPDSGALISEMRDRG